MVSSKLYIYIFRIFSHVVIVNNEGKHKNEGVIKGNCSSDLGVEATLPQPYGSTAIMQSSFLKRVSLVDGVFIFSVLLWT